MPGIEIPHLVLTTDLHWLMPSPPAMLCNHQVNAVCSIGKLLWRMLMSEVRGTAVTITRAEDDVHPMKELAENAAFFQGKSS